MPREDNAIAGATADEMGDKPLDKMAHHFMESLESLLTHQQQVVLRIGRRTTQMLRFTAIGSVVLVVAMLFLVYTFTSRMDSITASMDHMLNDVAQMHGNFGQVAQNVQDMELAVTALRQYVATMPNISHSVAGLGNDMQGMDGYMYDIELSVASMEQMVSSLRQDMYLMHAKFVDLNRSVGSMGRNVNQMSRPMSMFPGP